MHLYTFIKLPWIWLCVASITNTTATASKETSNKNNERSIFRTRFTFTRPTSGNVLSILLGGSKCREDHREERLICDTGMTKIKFNHGTICLRLYSLISFNYLLRRFIFFVEKKSGSRISSHTLALFLNIL